MEPVVTWRIDTEQVCQQRYIWADRHGLAQSLSRATI